VLKTLDGKDDENRVIDCHAAYAICGTNPLMTPHCPNRYNRWRKDECPRGVVPHGTTCSLECNPGYEMRGIAGPTGQPIVETTCEKSKWSISLQCLPTDVGPGSVEEVITFQSQMPLESEDAAVTAADGITTMYKEVISGQCADCLVVTTYTL
jgi:hypothetical protein